MKIARVIKRFSVEVEKGAHYLTDIRRFIRYLKEIHNVDAKVLLGHTVVTMRAASASIARIRVQAYIDLFEVADFEL